MKKKILIIEDELVVRSMYRRKFEMAGYQVETAEEGAAALSLLSTFKPDLIQADIMMPGMDGVEIIRQIRAWPEFEATPILVLSGFNRPEAAKEVWEAGASQCVSKMDCTPNLALELVEQLLRGQDPGFTPKQVNGSDSDGGGAIPLVDLEQLQSACDGNARLRRELLGLYFGQADKIMTGLGQAIASGEVGQVDHLAHKLAGSSLACGMSALVPALRQLEHNAKSGHLQGAPDWFAQVGVQLEAVRRYMRDYLAQNPG